MHRPTQFLRKGLGHSCQRCVCVRVQKYSHDSTLSKGEVLHQHVKTPVFIIEELPDPPVTHANREGLAGRQIKNTPLSHFTH